MNQKLSDWASIAEIFSSIAVVVTLVLLLLGIKENTEVTRASSFAESIDSINRGEEIILADPDLRRIYEAYLRRATSDLPDADLRALVLIIASIARRYDMALSMNRYGLMGENEWTRFSVMICDHYDRATLAGFEGVYLNLPTDAFRDFVSEQCM